MKKLNKNNMTLKGWLIVQAIILITGSISIFLLVEFIANIFFYHNPDYSSIDALGMFVPMGVLVGGISVAFNHTLFSYIRKLSSAMSKLSDGSFDITLDEASGGPLQDLYHDFNRMSQELNSVKLLKEDFINEFSHEFKTPLSSINGFANLLLERELPKEQQKKYLQIIADESERLALLSKNQLLLSNLETQEIITDKKSYSLDEQIRDCVILLSRDWEQKCLNLSLDLKPATYHGNPELMQHVWVNLISNAIKYTPPHGDIRISSCTINNRIQICIKDSGIGIAQEELDNIFQRYYRAAQPDGSIKGIGLGLSIVKRIVDLCNGTIKVSSSLSAGSCFTVILPLQKPFQ